MKELLNAYQAEAQGRLLSEPWVAELQKAALEDLQALGFPTRHDEEWKYTALDSFLQQHFSVAKPTEAESRFKADFPAYTLEIINGQVLGLDRLPKGVEIYPLAEALQTRAELFRPFFARKPAHGFLALNTAMLATGLVIHLPAGVRLDKPVYLYHWQDKADQAVYLRHLVVAESGSELTLIEHYAGSQDQAYFTNTLTEIACQAGAKVTHYKVQQEGLAAFHLGQLNASLAAGSELNSHSLSLGGRLVRSDLAIDLLAEEASCLMNGLYLPKSGQHVDHHTAVHHRVAHCRSQQDYKGILAGGSRAVFNGKVIVHPEAQKTEARQQNKNLLLAKNAEIDTKPQLEIFADDVVCTHGATVGQLDEDALFYLATRGIDREEATAYLVNAFAAENLALLGQTAMVSWWDSLIRQQLGDGHEKA